MRSKLNFFSLRFNKIDVKCVKCVSRAGVVHWALCPVLTGPDAREAAAVQNSEQMRMQKSIAHYVDIDAERKKV